MASTYSNLKFELIGTGDQSGTWGTTTNTNLGTAIEQALVGMATISSGFVTNSLTLTLTDTNAAQNARALVLNLTQALSGAGTLNVPAIQKPYMIINATGQTVTVKVTGLTGVAVPTGTRAFLYNNGTDVGDFFNYASSLTLGTDLAVADGGTGASTACGARTNLGLGTIATQAASNVNITGGSITGITDLAVADGGTGASSAPAARTNLGATTVGSNFFTLTNPSAITFLRINADNTVSALDAATFRTAIGAGTGGGSVSCVNTSGSVNGLTLTGGPITTTGTVTLGGGVNVSTITTGTLPVLYGGTGATTAPGALTNLGAYAASNPAGYAPGTVTSVATSGSINGLTLTGGPITTTGTVTLGGGVNVSTITTGTLPVARGGTGLCAVGTSGNVLTSNGTAWVSQAVAAGGANIQSFSSGGTYTKPPGAKFVMVEMWGSGGGGGGGLTPGNPSGGGGGGGYVTKVFGAPQVGATEPVTIGAGGAGGATSTSGARGGDTSFGTSLYVYGGWGGAANTPFSSAFGGGVFSARLGKIISTPPTVVSQVCISGNGASSPGVGGGLFQMGVWGGGAGGVNNKNPQWPCVPICVRGSTSMFGGGGGAGGGPYQTVSCALQGGRGRLMGAPPSSQNPVVGCGVSGGGGNGAFATSPSAGTAAVAGSCFNGGGGGVGLVNSIKNGAAGGIAAGGGAGGADTYVGTGGSGGSGYVIVYTWG